MENQLVSPCCGEEFEKAEDSYCCGAKISESGICYDCNDNAESEGYICDECEEWFEEKVDYSEYKETQRENNEEDRADSQRKYDE
tara:strand:- start:1410 stop:1664 length:255 start_codon:yes stop_codon:yes gene_type:complete